MRKPFKKVKNFNYYLGLVTSILVTFFITLAISSIYAQTEPNVWRGPTTQPPGGNAPGYIWNMNGRPDSEKQNNAKIKVESISADNITGLTNICLPNAAGCISTWPELVTKNFINVTSFWLAGTNPNDIYYDKGKVIVGSYQQKDDDSVLKMWVRGGLYGENEFRLYSTPAWHSGIRLLANYGGTTEYIQAGADAQDTDARLRFSRWSSIDYNLAQFQVYSDNSYFTGRLGIGTISPAEKFEVRDDTGGTARMRVTDTAQNPEIQLQYGAGGNDHWAFYVNQANDDLRLWNASDQVAFTRSGRVGIGANDPTVKLEVRGGTASAETTLLELRSAYVNHNTASTLRLINEPWPGITKRGAGEISVKRNLGAGADMTFRVSPQSPPGPIDTMIDVMTLKETGNVGIGTNSPSQKFEVRNGNVMITASNWNATGVEPSPFLYFGDTQHRINAVPNSGLRIADVNGIQFNSPEPQERMRITGSGDVYINSASGYPGYPTANKLYVVADQVNIGDEVGIRTDNPPSAQEQLLSGGLISRQLLNTGGLDDLVYGVEGYVGDGNPNFILDGFLGIYGSRTKINAAVFGKSGNSSDPNAIVSRINVQPNNRVNEQQNLWAGYFAGNVYIGNKLTQTTIPVTDRLTIDGNLRVNGNIRKCDSNGNNCQDIAAGGGGLWADGGNYIYSRNDNVRIYNTGDPYIPAGSIQMKGMLMFKNGDGNFWTGLSSNPTASGADPEKYRFHIVPWANQFKEVIVGANSPVNLQINQGRLIVTNDGSHSRAKIRMWSESNTADDYASHAIGTEPFQNTYGPGVSYANSIGHKFYVHGNEVAAQIGMGGWENNGMPLNRLNSQFFGNVAMGNSADINGYYNSKFCASGNNESKLCNNDADCPNSVAGKGCINDIRSRLWVMNGSQTNLQRLAIEAGSGIGPGGEAIAMGSYISHTWAEIDGVGNNQHDYGASFYGAIGDDHGNPKLPDGRPNPSYDSTQDWQLDGMLSAYNSWTRTNAAVYGKTVKRSDGTVVTYSANMGPNYGSGTDYQPLWAGYFAGNVYIGDKLNYPASITSVSEKLTIDGNVKINGNLQVAGTINGGGATQKWACGETGLPGCTINQRGFDYWDAACPAGYRIISGGGWCNSTMRESRPVFWSSTLNGFTEWRIACPSGGLGNMTIVCERP